MNKLLFYSACILIIWHSALYGQSVQTFSEKASQLQAKGDLQGAMSVLDTCVAERQELFECFNSRSRLRRMVGNFAGALEDLNEAIAIKADDGELFERRATLRLYQRDDAKLILSDLDSAISLGRKVETVYSARARIRNLSGDQAGAISDLQIAIGMSPDSPVPYLGLAGIYSSQNRYEDAVSLLEDFIRVLETSNSPLPVGNEEVILSTSNITPPTSTGARSMEGNQIIRRAITVGSSKTPPTQEERMRDTEDFVRVKNIAEVYGDLAELYRKQGKMEQAVAGVEKAAKIDPNAFYLNETRGMISTDKGDYKGAIDHFNSFLRVMSNFPRLYLERGFAYLMLGLDADAKVDFDAYLQMVPNGKAAVDKRVAEAKTKLKKK